MPILLSRQPSLSWGEYHVYHVTPWIPCFISITVFTSCSSFLVLDSLQASQCSNSCTSSSPSTLPPHVLGTAPHLISHFLICWFFFHLSIAIFILGYFLWNIFQHVCLSHLLTCIMRPKQCLSDLFSFVLPTVSPVVMGSLPYFPSFLSRAVDFRGCP